MGCRREVASQEQARGILRGDGQQPGMNKEVCSELKSNDEPLAPCIERGPGNACTRFVRRLRLVGAISWLSPCLARSTVRVDPVLTFKVPGIGIARIGLGVSPKALRVDNQVGSSLDGRFACLRLIRCLINVFFPFWRSIAILSYLSSGESRVISRSREICTGIRWPARYQPRLR
jgi:hypothetical protein